MWYVGQVRSPYQSGAKDLDMTCMLAEPPVPMQSKKKKSASSPSVSVVYVLYTVWLKLDSF